MANNNKPLYHGEVPLTPVQQWYLRHRIESGREPCLTALYRCEIALDESILKNTASYLMAQHDVLRLQYAQTATGWQQWCAQTVHNNVVAWEDLSDIPAQAHQSVLKARACSLQMQLKLTKGPIFFIRYLSFDAQVPGYLLLICHRLIADETSMQLLAQHFMQIYQQLAAGGTLVQDAQQDAFHHWADALQDWIRNDAIEPMLTPWLELAKVGAQNNFPMRNRRDDKPGVMLSSTLTLNAHDSQQLLRTIPERYYTPAESILLSALLLAASDLSDAQGLYLLLVCDARKAAQRFNRDLTQSLGWYAYHYPVCLAFARGQSLQTLLKRSKETLRSYPNDGLDYQLYRYMAEDAALQQHLQMSMPNVTVKFALHQTPTPAEKLQRVDTLERRQAGDEQAHSGLVVAFAQTSSGCLTVDIVYNNQRLQQKTISAFTEGLQRALQAIAAHGDEDACGGHTPSDFTAVTLTPAQIDVITCARPQLTDLLPISPRQEEMLLYACQDARSGAYISQLVVRWCGGLQHAQLQQAWSHVMREQPMLRSDIILQGCRPLLRGVVDAASLTLDLVQDAQAQALQTPQAWREWLQQQRRAPFVTLAAPQMHVAVIEHDSHSDMVWTFPQWLLDAESALRVLHRVIRVLSDATTPLEVEQTSVFQTYIQWLQPTAPSVAVPVNGLPIEAYHTLASVRHTELHWQTDIDPQQTWTHSAEQSFARLAACWLLLIQRATGAVELVVDIGRNDRSLPLYGVTQGIGVFQSIQRTVLTCAPECNMAQWLQQIETLLMERQESCIAPPAGPRIGLLYADEPTPSLLGPIDDNLSIERITLTEQPQYDLALHYHGVTGQVQLQFNGARFSQQWVDTFRQRLLRVTQTACTQPESLCRHLHLFDAQQQAAVAALRQGLRHTDFSLLAAQLAQRCAQSPEHTAVQCHEATLTFAQLDAKSNQLAHALVARGIDRRCTIALLLEPGAVVVVALLAVLKAGYPILLLRPEHTEQDYLTLLQKTQTALALTTQSTHQALSAATIDRLCLDLEQAYIDRYDTVAMHAPAHALYAWDYNPQMACAPVLQAYVAQALAALQQRLPFAAEQSCDWFGGVSLDKVLLSVVWPLLAGVCVRIFAADASIGDVLACAPQRLQIDALDIAQLQATAPDALAYRGQVLLLGPPCAQDVGRRGFQSACTLERVYTTLGLAAGFAHATLAATSSPAPLGWVLPNLTLGAEDAAQPFALEGVTMPIWVHYSGAQRSSTYATGCEAQWHTDQPAHWVFSNAQQHASTLVPFGPARSSQIFSEQLWCAVLTRDRYHAQRALPEMATQASDWLRAYRRLTEQYGAVMSLQDFMQQRSIAALAQQLDTACPHWSPAVSNRALSHAPQPLLGAQRRLWFIDRLVADNAQINHYLLLTLSSAQCRVFAARLAGLAQTQPALTLRFVSIAGAAPAAVSRTEAHFTWQEMTPAAQAQWMQPWSIACDHDALLQVRVCSSQAPVQLAFVAHPLLLDRASFYRLSAYLLGGQAPQGASYFAYAEWQEKLAEADADTRVDRHDDCLSTRDIVTFEVAMQWRSEHLNAACTRAIYAAADQFDTPVAVWLLAVYVLALSKVFARKHVCVGIERNPRLHPDLYATLGQMADVGVLRCAVQPWATVRDVLATLQDGWLQQLERPLCYDLTQQAAKMINPPARAQPYQYHFGYGCYHLDLSQASVVDIQQCRAMDFPAYWGVSLLVEPEQGGFRVQFGYNATHFEAQRQDAVFDTYLQCLQTPVEDSRMLVSAWLQTPVPAGMRALSAGQMQLQRWMAHFATQAISGYAEEIPLPIAQATWESCLQTLQAHLPVLTTGFAQQRDEAQNVCVQVLGVAPNWHCESLDLRRRGWHQSTLEKLAKDFIEHDYAMDDTRLLRFLLLQTRADRCVVVISAHPLLLSQQGCVKLLQSLCQYYATQSVDAVTLHTKALAVSAVDAAQSLRYWRDHQQQFTLQALSFPTREHAPQTLVTRTHLIPTTVLDTVAQAAARSDLTMESCLLGVLGTLLEWYCAPQQDFMCFRVLHEVERLDADVHSHWMPFFFALADFAQEAPLQRYIQTLARRLAQNTRYPQPQASALLDVALHPLPVVFDYQADARHDVFVYEPQTFTQSVLWLRFRRAQNGMTVTLSYPAALFYQVDWLEQVECLLQHFATASTLAQWSPHTASQYQRLAQGALKNRTWVSHESLGRRLTRLAPQRQGGVFLTLGQHSIGYASLLTYVGVCIDAMLADGVSNGQRVGVALAQAMEPVGVMLASVSIGAVCVPVTPDYNGYAAFDALVTAAALDFYYAPQAQQHATCRCQCFALTPSQAQAQSVQLPVIAQHAVAFEFFARIEGYPVHNTVLHNECLMNVEMVARTLGLQAHDVCFWGATENAADWVMQTLLCLLGGMRLVAATADADVAEVCITQQVSVFYGDKAQLRDYIDSLQGQDIGALRLFLCNAQSKAAAPDAAHFPVPCCTLQFTGGCGLPMAAHQLETQAQWTDAERYLGRPFADLKLYVLDRTQRFVPLGATGRLWFSGPRIQTELADAMFARVANPYQQQLSRPEADLFASMIDSGWLVQTEPDGKIRLLAFRPQQQRLPERQVPHRQEKRYHSPAVEALADIWATVLGCAPGMGQSLFALGGDSLQALRIMAQIATRLQVTVRYADFMRCGTFAEHCAWLEQQLIDVSPLSYALIKPLAPANTYPAAPAQARHWLQMHLHDALLWDQQIQVRLQGVVDLERLTQAIGRMWHEQRLLRCHLRAQQGRVLLMPTPLQAQFIPIVDLTQTPTEAVEAAVQALCEDYLTAQIDFEYDLLLRCNLIQCRAQDVRLVLTSSSLLLDESSMRLLAQTLCAEEAADTTSAIDIFAYQAWCADLHANGTLQTQRSACAQQLNDLPRLPLTPDWSQQQRLDLDATDANAVLTTLCTRYAVSESVVLLVVYQLLLAYYFEQTQIATVLRIDGRFRPDLAQMIGALDPLIVIRSDLEQEQTFAQVLLAAADALAQAQRQLPLALETVLQDAPNTRAPHDALQHGFAYHVSTPMQRLGALTVTYAPPALRLSRLALMLQVQRQDDRLRCCFMAHFHPAQAPLLTALRDDFMRLLVSLASAEAIGLQDWLAALHPPRDSAAVAVPETVAPCALQRILTQAEQQPQARAYTTPNGTITYQDMAQKIQRMQATMQRHEIPLGVKVGVCLPAGPECDISVIAVLHYGAVLAPLNAQASDARVHAVLDQMRIPYLITAPQQASLFTDYTGEMLLLDELLSADDAYVAPPEAQTQGGYVLLAVQDENQSDSAAPLLAYEYTRADLNALIAEQIDHYALTAARTLQLCPLDHPLFLQALLSTLGTGGALICASLDHGALPAPHISVASTVQRVFVPDTGTLATLARVVQGRAHALQTFIHLQHAPMLELETLTRASLSCHFQFHHVCGHWLTAFDGAQVAACAYGYIGTWVRGYQGQVQHVLGVAAHGAVGALLVQGAHLGQALKTTRPAPPMVGYVTANARVYLAPSVAAGDRLEVCVPAAPLLIELVRNALQQMKVQMQADGCTCAPLSLRQWHLMRAWLRTTLGVAAPYPRLRRCAGVHAIAAYAQQRIEQTLAHAPSEVSDAQADVRQTALWLQAATHSALAPNHYWRAVRLPATVDLSVVHAALQEVWRTHPILRSIFQQHESQLWRRTQSTPARLWAEPEALHEDDRQAAVDALCHAPWSLEAALHRIRLHRLNSGDYWLVLVLHPLLANEQTCQLTLAAALAPEQTHTPMPFTRYLALTQAAMPSDAMEALRQPLLDAIVQTRHSAVLPTLRSAAETGMAQHSVLLSADVCAELVQLGVQHNATQAMLYYSAYLIVLGLYAEQAQLVVAVQQADFTAEQALCLGPAHDYWLDAPHLTLEMRVAQLIQQVRERYVAQFARRYVATESLLALTPLSGLPLRDLSKTGFRMVREGASMAAQDHLDAAPLHTAQTDFELQVDVSAHAAQVRIVYQRQCYAPAMVANVLAQYTLVLSRLSSAIDAPLKALLDAPHALPAPVRATPTQDRQLGLAALFLQCSAPRQDAVALCCDATSLTYRQLLRRVWRNAHALQAAGVEAGQQVALHTKNAQSFVCLSLAVQMLGATPLICHDSYPPEPIALLLAQARTPWLLSDAPALCQLVLQTDITRVLEHPATQGDATPLSLPSTQPEVDYWVMNIQRSDAADLIPITQAQILQACAATTPLLPTDHRSVWPVADLDSPFSRIWMLWRTLLCGGVWHLQTQSPALAQRVPVYSLAQWQTAVAQGDKLPTQAVLVCALTQRSLAHALGASSQVPLHALYWLENQLCFVAQELLNTDAGGSLQWLPGVCAQIRHYSGAPLPNTFPGRLWVTNAAMPEQAAPWLDCHLQAMVNADDTWELLQCRDDLVWRQGQPFHWQRIEQALLLHPGVHRVRVEWRAQTDAASLCAHCWCAHADLDEAALRAHAQRYLPAFMWPDEFVLYRSYPDADVTQSEPSVVAEVSSVAQREMAGAQCATPLQLQHLVARLACDYALQVDFSHIRNVPWQRMVEEIASVVDPPGALQRPPSPAVAVVVRQFLQLGAQWFSEPGATTLTPCATLWHFDHPSFFLARQWRAESSVFPWLSLRPVLAAPTPGASPCAVSVTLDAALSLAQIRAISCYALAQLSHQSCYSLLVQTQDGAYIPLRIDTQQDSLSALAAAIAQWRRRDAWRCAQISAQPLSGGPLPAVLSLWTEAPQTPPPLPLVLQLSSQTHVLTVHTCAWIAPGYAQALLELLHGFAQVLADAPQTALPAAFAAAMQQPVRNAEQALPLDAVLQTLTMRQDNTVPRQHDSAQALTMTEQAVQAAACARARQRQISMLTPLPQLQLDAPGLRYFQHLLLQQGLAPVRTQAFAQSVTLRAFSQHLHMAVQLPKNNDVAEGRVSFYQRRLLFQERIAQISMENVMSIAHSPQCIQPQHAQQALQRMLLLCPLLNREYQWRDGAWRSLCTARLPLPLTWLQAESEPAVTRMAQTLIEEQRWRLFQQTQAHLFAVFIIQAPQQAYLVWVNHPLTADTWSQQRMVTQFLQLLNTHRPTESNVCAADYRAFAAWQHDLFAATSTQVAAKPLTKLALSVQALEDAIESYQRLMFSIAEVTQIEHILPIAAPFCVLALAAQMAQWSGCAVVHLLVHEDYRRVYRWSSCLGPLNNIRAQTLDFSQATLGALHATLTAPQDPVTTPIECVLPTLLNDIDAPDLRQTVSVSYELDLEGQAQVQWSAPSSSQLVCGVHFRFIRSAHALRCQLVYRRGFALKDIKALARSLAQNMLHCAERIEQDAKLPLAAPATHATPTLYGSDVAYTPAQPGAVLLRWRQVLAAQGDACIVRDAATALPRVQLQRRAQRIAAHLQAMGADGRQPIAIALPPDVQCVVALLAVLQVGCPYVLLDTEAPSARLCALMQTCDCAMMLTEQAILERLPECAVLPVCLDTDRDFINASTQLDATAITPAERLEVLCTPSAGLTARQLYFSQTAVLCWVDDFPGALDTRSVLYLSGQTHLAYFTTVVWLALLKGAQLVLQLSALTATDKITVFLHQQELADAGIMHRLSAYAIDSLYILVVDFARCETLLEHFPVDCDVTLFGGPIEAHYAAFFFTAPWGVESRTVEFKLFAHMQVMTPPNTQQQVAPPLWFGGAGLAEPEQHASHWRCIAQRWYVDSSWRGDFYDTGLKIAMQDPDRLETLTGQWHLQEMVAMVQQLPVVEAAFAIPGVHQWQLWVVSARPEKTPIFAALSQYCPDAVLPGKIRVVAPDYQRDRLLQEVALANSQQTDLGLSDFEQYFYFLLQVVCGALSVEQMQAARAQSVSADQLQQFADVVNALFQLDLSAYVFFQQRTLRDLMLYLNQIITDADHQSMPSAHTPEVFPLTLAQQYWLAKTPDAHDHTVQAVRLRGVLDLSKMVKAVRAMVAQTALLKICFIVDEDRQNQVLEHLTPNLEKIDFSRQEAAVARRRTWEYLVKQDGTAFDLQRETPFSLTLIRLNAQDFVLMLKAHKALADAYTLEQLFVAVGARYQGVPPPAARLNFAQYALLEKRRRQTFHSRNAQDYWADVLQQPQYQWSGEHGDKLHEAVLRIDAARIARLSEHYATHPVIVWLALWQLVLYAQRRQPVFLLHLNNAWRYQQRQGDILGALDSDCPLLAQIQPQDSVGMLVRRVRNLWLAGYCHKQTPFYVLQRKSVGAEEMAVYFDYAPPPSALDFGADIQCARFYQSQPVVARHLGLRIDARAQPLVCRLTSSCAQAELQRFAQQLATCVTLLSDRLAQVESMPVLQVAQLLLGTQGARHVAPEFVLRDAQQAWLRHFHADAARAPWNMVYCALPKQEDDALTREYLPKLIERYPLINTAVVQYRGDSGVFLLADDTALQLHHIEIDFDLQPPFDFAWLRDRAPQWLAQAPQALLHGVLVRGEKNDGLLLLSRPYLLDTIALQQLLLAWIAPQCPLPTVTPGALQTSMPGHLHVLSTPTWLLDAMVLHCESRFCALEVYFKALLCLVVQDAWPQFWLREIQQQRDAHERYALGGFWRQRLDFVAAQEQGLMPSLDACCQLLMQPTQTASDVPTSDAPVVGFRYRLYDAPTDAAPWCCYAESQWTLGDEAVVLDVVEDAFGLRLEWSGDDATLGARLLALAQRQLLSTG